VASDFADAVQKFISTLPGQLAAGGVLAGSVRKLFEKVETVLADNTKLEIALWLLGRKPISPKLQSWPDTFATVFDRVFGAKHLSWKCFGRSCVASFSVALIACWCLRVMGRAHSGVLWAIVVMIDLVFTFAIAASAVVILSGPFLFVTVMSKLFSFGLTTTITMLLAQLKMTFGLFLQIVQSPSESWGIVRSLTCRADPRYTLFFFPAFFTSVWLWLYAGSGFLLKVARRFDIGFDLFNRKLDIEKKPLSAMGLVAGALFAVLYWSLAIGVHFVSKYAQFCAHP
jgi:uncharacterized protein